MPPIAGVRQSERDRALCDRLTRRLTGRNDDADVQKLNVGRDTLMHLVAIGLGVSLNQRSDDRDAFSKGGVSSDGGR
jgi:hypothetical protein